MSAMIRPAAALLVLSAGAPETAQALDARCDFTQSCRDDAPCRTTEIGLRLRPGVVPGSVIFAGLGDSRQGELTELGWETRTLVSLGPDEVAVLTLTARGNARLTRHEARTGAATTYIGHCSEE